MSAKYFWRAVGGQLQWFLSLEILIKFQSIATSTFLKHVIIEMYKIFLTRSLNAKNKS